MIHDTIFKLGIPTQFLTIFSAVPNGTGAPGTGTLNIPITKILPTQIGRFIGLSTYTDSVGANNITNITYAQSQITYLLLKKGSNEFLQYVRMDDLLYSFPAQTSLATYRYLPVNIPFDVSMDQSYFINPTLYAPAPGANLQITLNIWYIDKVNYAWLINNKHVPDDGITPGVKR